MPPLIAPDSTTPSKRFFHQTDPTTLTTCDAEQIHLSGALQPIGAMLVVDPQSGLVIGASDNTAAFFAIPAKTLLGLPLTAIDPELAREVEAMGDQSGVLHEVLDFAVTVGGCSHDTVTHVYAGRRIIEFIPNHMPAPGDMRKKMRLCSKACSQILQTETFHDALTVAVDAVRAITGYDRVTIYQFQYDWSGKVIAESRNDVLPPFLGLCFPAGDIPTQVREIMKAVPYRAIGTTSDDTIPIRAWQRTQGAQTLDLSWSVLRSVSQMHTTYLRNIEVGSAFSCSLMSEGELWGLIAAHAGEEMVLPFDCWSLVQEIGTALMLRDAQRERVEVAQSIARLRRIESDFAAALRKEGDIGTIVEDLAPAMRDFLQADGFAFQFGHELFVSGQTPPKAFIQELIGWAMQGGQNTDQLHTNALHTLWPQAKAHMDVACGVLIQPIMVHRVCQLIWFRAPLTRTVRWAGQPQDKAGPGPLRPRASFDVWVQEHRDQSAPWREAELQSAREIFQEFLDILAAQFLLKEENTSLRQFAAAAAHDLRAPLIGLNMALEWMSEEGFEPASVKQTHALAQRSSRRMQDLTDGLLELVVLENPPDEIEPVELDSLVHDIEHLLVAQLEEHEAKITLENSVTFAGTQQLLLRLFLNLISNALKYRRADVAPRVVVSSALLPDGFAEVSVTDNGIGILPKHAGKVFEPLRRLHSKDKIEGAGLGLAICSKIVAAHGGQITLDETYTDGARFVVRLPVFAGKQQGRGAH